MGRKPLLFVGTSGQKLDQVGLRVYDRQMPTQPKDPAQTSTWPPVARTVFMLAVLIGLALGLRAVRGVAAPILLGLVVVIGASPLIGIMTKRRVPPVLAYIISLLVILVLIIALLFLMSFTVFQTRDLLPELQDQLTALQQDAAHALAGWGIDISGVVEEQVLNPQNIVGWISAALAALYGALKSMSLIVFIIAYLLVEVSGFGKRFYAALGEDRPALQRWLMWTHDTRSYLGITTVLAAAMAVLNFVLSVGPRCALPLHVGVSLLRDELCTELGVSHRSAASRDPGYSPKKLGHGCWSVGRISQ